MDDNFYINPLYVDGQYYQNFTNVMISNNEFIENASYKSLIEVNLSMYPTNVEVSTNKIIDFVSSSSVMIYVWTHYTNYYDESAAGG